MTISQKEAVNPYDTIEYIKNTLSILCNQMKRLNCEVNDIMEEEEEDIHIAAALVEKAKNMLQDIL